MIPRTLRKLPSPPLLPFTRPLSIPPSNEPSSSSSPGGAATAALHHRPDPTTLSHILLALCAAGRHADARRRLLLAAAAGILPAAPALDAILARLLDAPHTPAAITLHLLHTLAPHFTPSLTNYNRLAHHLCSHSQPHHAHCLLLDMESRGRRPNSVTYTTLINGFSRIGEFDVARRLFDEMPLKSIPRNSLTHSVLITGVLRKRRLGEAREMLRELWMKMEDDDEEDLCVKNAAFANLVNSLCREGLYHEVFWIAEEMPQGKCVPPEFAYGQMIDSLCRVGRHHGASRIVYSMRRRGFVPSLVSYNCIVHGLSKDGGCMRAYQLFKEGIGFGYSPSDSTYKVLVEGLCREMDLCKAKDVAEFMLQGDGIDKTRIYNIFLSALRLVDNPSEQLNVLLSMLQKQCRPDVITLNTVIHGFCKIGKVGEARKVLNDMMSGSFCSPDVVTFTTVIRGLLDIGNPEEALNLLHGRMHQCSCSPNVVTYNAVISGLSKLHKVDEAMQIFIDMVGKGVSSDSKTYTAIIEGLCEMGRLEEAKKFWDDVVWPSKTHDDYVYAAILRGLCRSGNLNEACDFLYELVDCGVSPGIVNYNILIGNACKIGLKREAYRIVGEMRKNGLEPDSITWRILDKLHDKGWQEDVSDDQISESKKGAEKTELYAEFEGGLQSIILEKERDINIVKNGYPLEGLGDPSLSSKLIDKEQIIDDCRGNDKTDLARYIIEEIPLQVEPREPLSRMARRVFGLL